jgi:alpha-tubulin suppressor-like RCC1 family protein
MSAAISREGELFTWGSSKNGGQVDANGQAYPQNLKLPTLFSSNEHLFAQVSAGKDHVAAVTLDG